VGDFISERWTDHLGMVGEDVLDLDAVERRIGERAGAVASGYFPATLSARPFLVRPRLAGFLPQALK
jgi:hypothetical protein